MLILKLVYNEDISFYKELNDLKDQLKKKEILIGIVESMEGNTHIIKVICDDETYNEKIKEIINIYVSNILYRVVIDNYKKKEMFEFLTDNYFFLKQSEIIEVEEYIDKILKCKNINENDNSIYCLNKINEIINKINECISEKQEINIDGFITFRMRKLTKKIEQIVDKIIEIYLIEKEYNEFIKLLKYFVDLQECRINVVNIIFNDNDSYDIEDENGKSLYKEFLKELNGDEYTGNVNDEDIIISGLITSSPKNIIIYNKEKCRCKEFLNTIEKVFGERVSFENGKLKLNNIKSKILK